MKKHVEYDLGDSPFFVSEEARKTLTSAYRDFARAAAPSSGENDAKMFQALANSETIAAARAIASVDGTPSSASSSVVEMMSQMLGCFDLQNKEDREKIAAWWLKMQLIMQLQDDYRQLANLNSEIAALNEELDRLNKLKALHEKLDTTDAESLSEMDLTEDEVKTLAFFGVEDLSISPAAAQSFIESRVERGQIDSRIGEVEQEREATEVERDAVKRRVDENASLLSVTTAEEVREIAGPEVSSELERQYGSLDFGSAEKTGESGITEINKPIKAPPPPPM